MLRSSFILRHCSVRLCTPHSSGFARLACGAFYGAVEFGLFFDFLQVNKKMISGEHYVNFS